MEVYELLQQLTAAFGPSGDEGRVRETIASLAAPFGGTAETDAMGSLVIRRRGTGRKILFDAHMDSVGLMVTHIESDGTLRFGALGWLPVQDIRRQNVVFRNGVRGIVEVPEDKEDAKELKVSDLYVDIGAKDAQEAGSMVRIGDTAVYDGPIYRQGDRVFSRYLDNRSGCAVLLRAMELLGRTSHDLYFAFSVQEEVGLRGAKPIAYGIDPDVGISVDVTASDDVPGSSHEGSSVLGKGPAVKVMDHSVICQSGVVRWMNDTARDAGISVQQDVFLGGGTDSGAIQPARMGIYTGGICIPCRYAHTPVEECDLGDLESAARLVAALAEHEYPES